MAKLTLTDITTGYLTQDAYNANNALIEAAFENTLSRDGSTPNEMSAALDMNSKDINNVKDINNAQVIKTTALQIGGVSVVPGSTLTVPTAANVPNVPAGLIAATDVQAALNELDTEKMALAEAQTVTGDKTFSGANAFSGVNVFSDINIFTGAIATDSPVVHRAVVANHVRAGNIQIIDGNSSDNFFSITNNVTENSFETVGPTGSGATNIWDAMDNLPSNATILICRLKLSLSTSGVSTATITIHVTEGDSSSGLSGSTILGGLSLDHDVNIDGISATETEVLIPLEPNNQDFRTTWIANLDDIAGAILYYKGFITD